MGIPSIDRGSFFKERLDRLFQPTLDSFSSFEEIFSSHFPPEVVGDPSILPNDRLCSQDYLVLEHFKDAVISGYLNLGVADGWQEGSDPRLGTTFIRYILLRYFLDKQNDFGMNTSVLERAAKAFKGCETLLVLQGPQQAVERHTPKESQICLDSTVLGYQKHAICRLVGNVGTTYNPSKPFFEILVNSVLTSKDSGVCQPFFISIHANEEELEKRRCRLQSLKLQPGEIADYSFYAIYLKKPNEFLEKYRAKLGFNGTRLLKALAYLQDVTLQGQTVGNCWMKQSMRSLLATLYVELISQRLELEPDVAWREAIALYKKIQQVAAIPFVQDLIRQSSATAEMKKAALRSIENRVSICLGA